MINVNNITICREKIYAYISLSITALYCLAISILPFTYIIEYKGPSDFFVQTIAIFLDQYEEGPTAFFYIHTSGLFLSVLPVINVIYLSLSRGYQLLVCAGLGAFYLLINVFLAFQTSDIPLFSLGVFLWLFCFFNLKKIETSESSIS